MEFGVYPGSASGDDRGELVTGVPDDPDAVRAAVLELQGGPGRPFLLRGYLSFTDDTDPAGPHAIRTPAGVLDGIGGGRALDLVAQYWSRDGDVAGYCAFLRALVTQHGAITATLQVGEEPNVAGLATLDGDYPRVREAVVAGVSAAKDEARRRGHAHLRVGFNTTPLFGPAAAFPAGLVELGGSRFLGDLDYVGLDFFPDVFAPVAPDALPGAVRWLLGHHRHDVLGPAGLGSNPIHITEHGWPTGPARPPERQAEVVDTVVRAVAGAAAELGLAVYTHFSLRDADSGRDGLFHRFGLMTDRYEPKPAFGVYRALVAELSNARA